MDYRKDIEGLRAIAVVPIVLFHAGLETLSGGFVGVDVFFVISGFLITSILSKDIADGTFSFLRFYSRRVLRIFPALFLMLVVVLIVVTYLLFPAEVRSTAESAAATATFVSNVYFWLTADYFAVAADLQVFLHTWSLGIEEQFYIGYPLFIFLLAKVNRQLIPWGVAALLGASFVLAFILVTKGFGQSSFYLLPTRMWELGLGGLVALGLYPKISNHIVRTGIGIAGLGLLLLAFFVVDAASGFPAPWALMPCGATAALIAYGPHTVAARVLQSPVFVWFGRLSYSLYLWHWPILSLYRIYNGIILTPIEGTFLVLFSVAAAFVSYNFVELPFSRRFRAAPPKIVVGTGLAFAACIACIAMLLANNAHWRHYSPRIERILAVSDYRATGAYQYQFRPGKCFIEPANNRTPVSPVCMALSDTKPNMIVAGDSFAAHYWRAFELRFRNYKVLQASAPSCRPIVQSIGSQACTSIMRGVLGRLAASGRVSAIVLAGRWIEADLSSLAITVRQLREKGIRVLVVGPSVEYEGEYPNLLARAVERGDISIVNASRRTELKALSDRMKLLVHTAGGVFASPYDLECPAGKCDLFNSKGDPTNFDCCHLTLQTAIDLVRRFPPP